MSTEKKFKKVRLFRLAKSFNVSVDALVEHLEESGFADSLVGSGINAAVATEEAYEDLMDYFADDKEQAERVSRKRAARQETDGDEEASEETAEAVASEPEEASAPEPEAEPEPEATPEAEEVEAPEEEATVEEPVAEEEATVEEASEEPAETEETEAEPAEEAPATEEAAEPVAEESEEPSEDAAPEVAEEEAPASEAPAEEAPVEAAPAEEAVAEATKEGEAAEGEDVLAADRYKLTGTKVLGKIDLGKVEDAEPGSKRRKRKRKRIAGTGTASDSGTDTAKRSKKRKKGPAVDEKDVEATLQETLRELEAGASRVRQKRRRQRRDDRAAERELQEMEREDQSSTLRVTEFISTGELANLMDVAVTDVISTLFQAGMMVSINQRLDADTITIVADEFGFEIEFIADFTDTDVVDQRCTTGTIIQPATSTASTAAPPIRFRLRVVLGASLTSCADVSAIFSVFPQFEC